jgi:hypothetical protein
MPRERWRERFRATLVGLLAVLLIAVSVVVTLNQPGRTGGGRPTDGDVTVSASSTTTPTTTTAPDSDRGTKPPTPAGSPRIGAVVGMAGGSASILAASVLADLASQAGSEAIATGAQLRKFAIEQAAGPFTKTLSEGLAKGLADKVNSLWGANLQAKGSAVDRVRTEVYQALVIELRVGLAQGAPAIIAPENERAAIAQAVAAELANRLAAQIWVRIAGMQPEEEPFTG